MTDYPAIERRCRRNSRYSETLVDGFLLDYSDERDDTVRDFTRDLEMYRHITADLPEHWFTHVITQYLGFRLFREKGLARKYRGHPAMRQRSEEELEWLDRQFTEPWHFCFCTILNQPHRDFYMMQDVCSGEIFLMYSPAMSRGIDDLQGWPALSLVLMNSNDTCRETYGPLLHFKGLFPGDLVFFARQLQSNLRRLEEVPAVINRDPIPFILLSRWGNMPATVHKQDFLILHRLDIHNVNIDPVRMKKNFTLNQRDHVLKYELKRWRRHPHFAGCIYDTRKRLLIARAMTERSWEKLTDALEDAGVKIDSRHLLRGTASVVVMAEQLFGRKFQLTDYDKLFEEAVDPDRQAELDKLNAFLSGYFEAWNRGVETDIDSLARAYGIDPAMAHDIIEQITRDQNLRRR